MSVPELIAHRGYARRFPENTLAAIDAAIRAGARHVEIDVQITSDGFPVLFHDRTLDRMCGVAGAIHERTLADLRTLSCHEPKTFGERFRGEGIASLASFAQLVRQHPHVHAFVEVKRVAIERLGNERVLEKVLAAIEPAIAQCSLISFSIPFLTATRRAHRSFPARARPPEPWFRRRWPAAGASRMQERGCVASHRTDRGTWRATGYSSPTRSPTRPSEPRRAARRRRIS